MDQSSGYISNKFVNYTLFEMGVYMELDYFETYCSRMEIVLEEEENQLRNRFQEESMKLDGYEKAAHFESFESSYEYKFVTDIFPNLQRKSGLISLYSILERNLIQICKMHEEKSDNHVKMNDLNNEGYIEKARTYLTKIVQIDLPENNEFWQMIKMTQELRNKCAHLNGAIPTGNAPLIKHIRNSKYLDISRPEELFSTGNKNQNERYQLKIKSGYLEQCVAEYRAFFENLFEKLQNKNSPTHKPLPNS